MSFMYVAATALICSIFQLILFIWRDKSVIILNGKYNALSSQIESLNASVQELNNSAVLMAKEIIELKEQINKPKTRRRSNVVKCK